MALALMVTGCVGTPEHEEKPGAEKPTAPAPRGTGPVDPASGGFTRAWQADVRGTFDPESTDFAFAAGRLLVFSKRGVDALGIADGRALWRHHVPGAKLVGHARTADTVVLTTSTGEAGGRTTGLDAATGKVLWRSTPPTTLGTSGPRAVGEGIVAMPSDEPASVYGIDARTGDRRWNRRLIEESTAEKRHCSPADQERSEGGVMLVSVTCEPKSGKRGTTLFALVPGTGRPLWQRPMDDRPVQPVSKAGVTLLPEVTGTSSTGATLISRDGRDLYRVKADGPLPLLLGVAEGRAVIHSWDPEAGDNRLRSVDLRTGKASAPVPTKLTAESATAAGHVYGLRWEIADGNERALPTGLEVVDPRTMRVTRVPLPSSTGSPLWSQVLEPVMMDPHREGVLLDGGRAYTVAPVEHGLRLTGFVPGDPAEPVELGGVPLKDWPDPCRLGAGLGGVTGRYTSRLPRAPRTVPGRSCDFDTPNGPPFGYRYRVWMAWVSRDAAQADQMLDPAGTNARKVAGLGDEAYGFAMLGDQQGLVFRVGRYVAAVREDRDADPRPMADVVARNLRRLH